MILVDKKRGFNQISMQANILLNIFFIMFSVACIYPVLLIIGVSFTKESALTEGGYRLIPKIFDIYAYKFVFRDGEAILRAYLNTIVAATLGTLLSVFSVSTFAYSISRREFKYRKIFTYFLIATMVFNGGLVSWYMVCVRMLQIQNTYLALILPMAANGFNIIIMRTFFRTNVPDEIIESAKIDGSGDFRTFFQIVMPLAVPGLATIGLFTVINYWNDFFTPLMLCTDQHFYNIQFMMYKILVNSSFMASIAVISYSGASRVIPSETARMAMAVISIGPIIFAYPFLQKYFIKGLTIGALKG